MRILASLFVLVPGPWLAWVYTLGELCLEGVTLLCNLVSARTVMCRGKANPPNFWVPTYNSSANPFTRFSWVKRSRWRGWFVYAVVSSTLFEESLCIIIPTHRIVCVSIFHRERPNNCAHVRAKARDFFLQPGSFWQTSQHSFSLSPNSSFIFLKGISSATAAVWRGTTAAPCR